MESIFDETLPWKKLPHFIQERIYWRPMVHARNEMGWKALHQQLCPLEDLLCWDCGNRLTSMKTFENILVLNGDFLGLNQFRCEHCNLMGRRKLYRVASSHEGMFPRTDLPFYKIHVFGYLVESIYRPRACKYHYDRLLTGYHVSHGIIGDKTLTRYYDEDNEYTRQYHIFRPVFLWNELRASFA